jgi:hypothetical protein
MLKNYYSISYLLDEIRCVVYFYDKERDKQEPNLHLDRKTILETQIYTLQHNIIQIFTRMNGIKGLIYSYCKSRNKWSP